MNCEILIASNQANPAKRGLWMWEEVVSHTWSGNWEHAMKDCRIHFRPWENFRPPHRATATNTKRKQRKKKKQSSCCCPTSIDWFIWQVLHVTLFQALCYFLVINDERNPGSALMESSRKESSAEIVVTQLEGEFLGRTWGQRRLSQTSEQGGFSRWE